MQTLKNKTDKNFDTVDNDFHAVDYMRQVRAKLSQQYLADKESYLQFVRQAMSDFKARRLKANRQ